MSEPKRLWTHSNNAGTNYLNQLNSWARIAKTNPKDGSVYYDWKQTARNDHMYDCEKMQLVAAAMAGLIGVSEKPADEKD